MCEKDCLSALKFVPDCFFAPKMLRKLDRHLYVNYLNPNL